MFLNILILLNRIDSYQKIYLYLCPIKREFRLSSSNNQVFTYFLRVSDELDFYKDHSKSMP